MRKGSGAMAESNKKSANSKTQTKNVNLRALNFNRTLVIRTASGAGFVIVLLLFLWLGGVWWHAFATFASLGSLWEFYRMYPNIPLAARCAGFAAATFVLFVSELVSQTGLMVIFALACFAAYFAELLRRQMTGESFSILTVGPVVAGLIYTAIPWYCLIRFRELPGLVGFAAVLNIFLCTWMCDVMAYLVGSKLGTAHVCPHISPNKSLEGFIGGFLASVLCGGLCALYFKFSPMAFILVGVACGSFGQLGDLVESLIKRENGVKDSGRILPGHGGFLDRFDSVLINSLCAWVIWWGFLA